MRVPALFVLLLVAVTLAAQNPATSDSAQSRTLSKVGKIHLTEMVDPNYVVVASIEKKFLPPKK
jgi:hypothetical protein